ncbi:hypothetical protein [Paraburkholderia phytofirmans]|uniref:Lipoprotein n=1 Tax=Paraburkholderia phytofirmans (strain DSM 17436 / LMG 22146 / PsJN) TaxID=398527 RepID=B2SXZ6_PARPJ|nr:hypothetical protein [Paraburkholderia phytofirmans]ACD17075.1 hypothetical protein Bphyt_2680 [Paraburkholderia phytofirmans PsJN]
MKIRILPLVCVTTAAALLTGCTAVYKNTDACEQLMRSKLAETSPDTLKITHAATGIHGSRVVVEGSIEHVVAPASASAAASAPLADSAVAVGAAGALSASNASNASNASDASATKAFWFKSAKTRKTVTPAAAECTFNGPTLNVFNWLAPANLVAPATDATE